MLSVEQELTDAKKECLHSNRIIQSFEVQYQTSSQVAVFLLKFVSGNLVHCGFLGSGKGNQSFQLWSHISNMPPLGSQGMPDQDGLVTIGAPFPINPRCIGNFGFQLSGAIEQDRFDGCKRRIGRRCRFLKRYREDVPMPKTIGIFIIFRKGPATP